MSDRADYLARTIVRRLRAIEAIAREDFSADDPQLAGRQLETVAKILAVDAGVTDGITVRTVLSAVPHLPANSEPSPREMREFASFLRERLPEF
jgi:hypothetical protein